MKHSFGLAKQQVRQVRDNRSIRRTSLLSCCRDTVSCGPDEMKKRVPPSCVSFRKSHLAEFSALRQFSDRGFTWPPPTRRWLIDPMRTSRRGKPSPSTRMTLYLSQLPKLSAQKL